VIGPVLWDTTDHHVGITADFDFLQSVLVHQRIEVAVSRFKKQISCSGGMSLARSVKPAMSANRTGTACVYRQ
jgi:hypothetical protein